MRSIGWGCLGTALLFGCGSTSGGGSVVPPGMHDLKIHVAGSGSGRVHSVVPAFECTGDCTQSVASGQSVILDATPAPGSSFAGWQGQCSGPGSCSLTLDGDRDVTAAFTTLPPASAQVTVIPVGKGIGRVTSIPSGIDCPGTCSMVVPFRSRVSLAVQSDTASNFIGWGGACSGAAGCGFAADHDQTVWVDFEAKSPPPSSSCAGISAPDAPQMRQWVRPPTQYFSSCGSGVADAGGAGVIFAYHYDDPSVHADALDFIFAVSTTTWGMNQGLGLIEQPMGVVAVSGGPYLGPLANRGYHLQNFDSAGKSKGETFIFGSGLTSVGDPQGGVLFAGDLATSSYDPYRHTATPYGPLTHSAVMFEGGGAAPALRWNMAALASKGTVFGAGVDTAHRSLIITDGTAKFGAGSISAQWFDSDGTALTGEFLLLAGFVPGSSTWFETSPLIGSGLMIRRMDGLSHARALVTVASGVASARPAPEWMLTRADTRLQIARGGRAYAVLPYAAKNAACSQRVEVVAPDGTSCGSREYSIAEGTCDTHDLALGADGTVIQQLPDSMESQGSVALVHSCTWRWWPGAVR